MRADRRSIQLITVLLLGITMHPSAAQQSQPIKSLFIRVQPGTASDASRVPGLDEKVEALRKQPTSKSVQVVSINISALRDSSTSIALSDAPPVVASRKMFKRTGEDSFVWQGTLNDVPGNATLVVHGTKASGMIQDGLKQYRVESLPGTYHAVVQIDQAKFPAEHPPQSVGAPSTPGNKPPQVPKPSPLGDASAGPTSPSADVLVAYTSATSTALATTSSSVAELAELAVEITNTTFQNSAIDFSLSLAGTREFKMQEYGTFEHILDMFVADKNIEKALNDTGADLAILIVEKGDSCGLAKAIGANADTAYAIVSRTCAIDNLSFAHELGHLLGARHDPGNDPSPGFAHGHQHRAAPDKAWRTVMAYDCPKYHCPRLPYWSTPKVKFNGIPTGVAGLSDNARVLNSSAGTVAAFRVLSAASGLASNTGNPSAKKSKPPAPSTADGVKQTTPPGVALSQGAK